MSNLLTLVKELQKKLPDQDGQLAQLIQLETFSPTSGVYDHTVSGLAATTVQAAIDEVVADLAVADGLTIDVAAGKLEVKAGGIGTTQIAAGILPTALQTDGQAGVAVPRVPGWIAISNAFQAKRALFSRFVLNQNQTISSIKLRTETGGTGNVDVCIINSSGTILRSSGSVAGKKGATTWQTVNLSAPLALTAGTVYYVGVMTDVSDGAISCAWWDSSTGKALDVMWGSTLGLCQSFFNDVAAFPFAAQTIAISFTSASVGPIAGLA